MNALLTIGEVSRRSGVAASALRFYEERGLIASERAGSGHRRYARPVLRRIAFIVFAQRVGLTLDEIGAELAKLPHDATPTRSDWSLLTSTWRSRIGPVRATGSATALWVADARLAPSPRSREGARVDPHVVFHRVDVGVGLLKRKDQKPSPRSRLSPTAIQPSALNSPVSVPQRASTTPTP
jgi:DNA-binding transcriptional MerR regulator